MLRIVEGKGEPIVEPECLAAVRVLAQATQESQLRAYNARELEQFSHGLDSYPWRAG